MKNVVDNVTPKQEETILALLRSAKKLERSLAKVCALTSCSVSLKHLHYQALHRALMNAFSSLSRLLRRLRAFAFIKQQRERYEREHEEQVFRRRIISVGGAPQT